MFNKRFYSIMNTQVQVFNHEKFGSIRISTVNGKQWFCLSDVCRALEINNARDVKRRLQKGGVDTIDTPVKNNYGVEYLQPMTYIDEPNLYRCIFQSRKEEAEKFQAWVFDDVLPQIRKTGGYIPVSREDDEKTILCKALHIMQNTVALRDREIAEKKQKIAELAPLADYADQVLLSPKCYTMTEIAKFEGMTVQNLQHLLHELRIIYRSPSGPFMLYADHLDKGYEAYRTRKGCDLFGNVLYTNTYLVWTEQGRKFIHDYLKCPFVNEIA